ncbi:MAG: cytochrome c biogenesis protein CcsA [bacterium]|nr:cytochrome c biogenesis protein CcsA [bacterium]
MAKIPYKWYKILAILLLCYTIIYGLLIPLPSDVGMLDETIRNLFYHVPMWFGMMLILMVAWIYSIMYLQNQYAKYEIIARALTFTGILMGLCGLFTGMFWGYNTWGSPWTNDPKLNGVAVGMTMYAGYWLIQKSVNDGEKKARLASVYNIFIFPLFIALIFVMPKLAKFSIHPGSGESVNFKTYNKTNNMEIVFYPAIIGWTLLFVWIAEIRARYELLKQRKENEKLFA